MRQGNPTPPNANTGKNVSPSLATMVHEKVWGSKPNCPQVFVRGKYMELKEKIQTAQIIHSMEMELKYLSSRWP